MHNVRIFENRCVNAATGAMSPQPIFGRPVCNAPAPDFSEPAKLVDPATIDLRLRADSPAIDAGTLLPGITDGCTGDAPDPGACEYGRAPPQHGPRERSE
jgi:hypothetical protein